MPYFEKMLCFPGIEAREGVIRMSDRVDTWVAFELFLEFTYLGDYDIKEDSYVGASAHIAAYVFAERICMESLKKYALEMLSHTISKSYKPIRKLLAINEKRHTMLRTSFAW